MSLSSPSGFNSGTRIIGIFHGFVVRIEKFVTRITDRHHAACLVILNCDSE